MQYLFISIQKNNRDFMYDDSPFKRPKFIGVVTTWSARPENFKC